MKSSHKAIISGIFLLLFAAACTAVPTADHSLQVAPTLISPSPSPSPTAAAATQTPIPSPTTTAVPSPTPNPYAEEYNTVKQAFAQDFDSLQTINPDILAWLEIGSVKIDQPVLLGPDNEYYLDIGFDKTPTPMGSVYFDMRTQRDFSDNNLVIYGHNWDNGKLFSELMKFRKQDFLDEHQSFYLYTPERIYRAQIAAVAIVDNDDPSMLFPSFETDAELNAYFDRIKEKTVLSTELELKPEDQVISLYTCTNNAWDHRQIIIAKLIEIGREDPRP